MDKISAAGYKIIDATCPFVKKAQHYAKLLKEEGYQVIILGDREHPEVQGLMSYAGKNAVVVDGTKGPIAEDKAQRGDSGSDYTADRGFKEIIRESHRAGKDVKVYNTICNSTALRLKRQRRWQRGGHHTCCRRQKQRKHNAACTAMPGTGRPYSSYRDSC